MSVDTSSSDFRAVRIEMSALTFHRRSKKPPRPWNNRRRCLVATSDALAKTWICKTRPPKGAAIDGRVLRDESRLFIR